MGHKDTNSKDKSSNLFEQSVRLTPDVSSAYKVGLRALGANSSHISVSDHSKLQGSVDIDGATKRSYPNDSRWDYAIGYDDKAYFVEIHPMETSNVEEVIKKKKWLDEWLCTKAPEIKKITANNAFYWVASGRYRILANSKEARRIATSHINAVKKFII